MAKTEEIKFFDQHMEKVILGVCALIMAYGVFQWVLSAPERPEVPTINGRVVASKDLDQELLVWAKNTHAHPSSNCTFKRASIFHAASVIFDKGTKRYAKGYFKHIWIIDMPRNTHKF